MWKEQGGKKQTVQENVRIRTDRLKDKVVRLEFKLRWSEEMKEAVKKTMMAHLKWLLRQTLDAEE